MRTFVLTVALLAVPALALADVTPVEETETESESSSCTISPTGSSDSAPWLLACGGAVVALRRRS